MNNVSFGSLCVQKSTDFVTKKQRKVEEEADKAFCQFSDEYYPKGDIIHKTYLKNTIPLLANLLEEAAGADIYVRHKKDGNVELSLRKELSEGNCEASIINDENNKPIVSVLDLTKPMNTVKKQLLQFADRSLHFVHYCLDRKNDE